VAPCRVVKRYAGLTSTFANLSDTGFTPAVAAGKPFLTTIRRFSSLIESGANHFKFRMLILRCSSHILMAHGLHHRREIPGKGRAFTGSTE